LDKRTFQGKLQYLVKWEDTWESKENCMQCPERIREFEESYKKRKKGGGGGGRPKSGEKKGQQNGPNVRFTPFSLHLFQR
jgi:hypothetical protein